MGAATKNKLRRRAPGGGRPTRYLFSGLLRCGECGASFSLADKNSYSCASREYGAACSNALRVRRTLVESRILEGVKADLINPEVIAQVERRRKQGTAAKKPKAANATRIVSLQKEIANLVDAVAGGALRSSPALATRLSSAEVELARLTAESRGPASRIGPSVAPRYKAIMAKLEETLSKDVARRSDRCHRRAHYTAPR